MRKPTKKEERKKGNLQKTPSFFLFFSPLKKKKIVINLLIRGSLTRTLKRRPNLNQKNFSGSTIMIN